MSSSVKVHPPQCGAVEKGWLPHAQQRARRRLRQRRKLCGELRFRQCTIGYARLPHLHRDWAHACHICTGTGLSPRFRQFTIGCARLPSSPPAPAAERWAAQAREPHGTTQVLRRTSISCSSDISIPSCQACARMHDGGTRCSWTISNEWCADHTEVWRARAAVPSKTTRAAATRLRRTARTRGLRHRLRRRTRLVVVALRFGRYSATVRWFDGWVTPGSHLAVNGPAWAEANRSTVERACAVGRHRNRWLVRAPNSVAPQALQQRTRRCVPMRAAAALCVRVRVCVCASVWVCA
jgi:hypothetical protein